MAKKNRSQKVDYRLPVLRYFWAVLLVSIGFGVGWGFKSTVFHDERTNYDNRYKVASQQEVQQTRDYIRDKFLNTDELCQDGNQEITELQKSEFDRTLKVNKYANRAVFTGCEVGTDRMVVRDFDGTWYPSSVNLILDYAHNPMWAVECLIDDIVELDYKVKPENSSIDAANLGECRDIRTRENLAEFVKALNGGQYPDGGQTDTQVQDYVNFINSMGY